MKFGKRRAKDEGPITFVPKKYQKKGISFCLERAAAGLFLAPGLGKTAIMLMVFKLLRKAKLIDEMVVMTKKRIVYNVWPQEVAKWAQTSELVVKILHGSHKDEVINEKADIWLINYEGLEWLLHQRQFFKRKKRLMLVCDESSKLKNKMTLRFKTLKKMLPKFHRRYILTGSPAPNGLMGLFSQVFILDFGDALGQFIGQYRNEYFKPSGFMGRDWTLQKGAEERIFKKLRPLILRFGHDQLDLPPLTFVDRHVVLPTKSRDAYEKLEEEFILEYKAGDIIASNAAVASGKLRQIANGAVYYSVAAANDEERKVKKWRPMHEEKCEELLELLEELDGEPALVAFEFNHDVLHLRKFFAKNAREYEDFPYIGKGAKEKDIQQYIRQWENGKFKLLGASTESASMGLNLQGKGGIVIFYSLTWNLESYEQFYQRVWRQGQTRRVIVYRIVARNTVDEVITAALRRKDKTQSGLLKAMEEYYELR